METLLTPSHSTQEEIYDREKALELFVPGHTDIGITVSCGYMRVEPINRLLIDFHILERFSEQDSIID